MSNGFDFETIYSLDSRSNIMLDLFKDDFHMSEAAIFREIQREFSTLLTCLSRKGVNYKELKPALIPDAKKLERAYIFDWNSCNSSWDGNEVHDFILPLLPRDSSRSILAGDWISSYSFAEVFCKSKKYPGDHFIARSAMPETLYFVYMNNLSKNAAINIEKELIRHPAYIGYLDLSYMSLLKAFLAHMLTKLYIQNKNTIIQANEDDTPFNIDDNLIGFNFMKHGYREKSVPQRLYSWFLSYKIECPVLRNHDSDTRFSLNALTPELDFLDDLDVVLDAAKHQYLQREKEGSMRRSGMWSLSTKEISSQIRDQLNSNYLYNLSWAKKDLTIKFNIMLEVPGIAKYIVALKYLPKDRELRVLTIF